MLPDSAVSSGGSWIGDDVAGASLVERDFDLLRRIFVHSFGFLDETIDETTNEQNKTNKQTLSSKKVIIVYDLSSAEAVRGDDIVVARVDSSDSSCAHRFVQLSFRSVSFGCRFIVSFELFEIVRSFAFSLVSDDPTASQSQSEQLFGKAANET
jgi:hypothetical protein